MPHDMRHLSSPPLPICRLPGSCAFWACLAVMVITGCSPAPERVAAVPSHSTPSALPSEPVGFRKPAPITDLGYKQGIAQDSQPSKPDAAQTQRLASVDSERIFLTAVAAEGVPLLAVVGPASQIIPNGATAAIRVRTVPGGDVSFTVREGGEFPNQRASITVRAGEDGIATTVFMATPGTVDDVHIQAGSPQAVGTIMCPVHVLYPGSPFAR